jgi:hypothetical protein
MDQLQVIDGYFGDNAFYIRSLVGFPFEGRFKNLMNQQKALRTSKN